MSAAEQRPPVWVGHITMETDRLDESEAFMRAIGMRPVVKTADLAVLELRGGTHLVLFAKPQVRPEVTAFDLMVEDLESTHRRFVELGLAVSAVERAKIHDSFTVTEPAGNTIKFNSTHVGDQPV